MSEPSETLVCRNCKRVPELVEQEGGGNLVCCPGCGASGDRHEVIEAAREYLARSLSHSAIRDFQRRQRTSASRSKNARYIPGKLPNLSPPSFIFDDQPDSSENRIA